MHDPISLPTTPGAIIGYRKNGTPIRLIAGGNGEGGTGGDGSGAPAGQPAGTGADSGQTGAQPSDPGQGPDGTAAGNDGQPGADGDISSLPEWAQKAIRDARAEAAKSRTTAKQTAAEQARQDLAQQIGKALGLVKDGDKAPDPAQLAQELAASQDEGRQARVELAVYKAAAKAGADPEALLDSRAFLAQIKDVDPGDAKKISDLIKKAVESNPKVRAVQAPPASGAPMGGQPPTSKPKSLEAAIAARYRK
ncbi:hypothetical protein [Actinomadura miaoliensis]|uniref:Uncharacterized protein n=1 Tax=Actinomadura miaoliensis TaxID=430685 RepID=A0ABP7V5V5_9ACTN